MWHFLFYHEDAKRREGSVDPVNKKKEDIALNDSLTPEQKQEKKSRTYGFYCVKNLVNII
jgi:hypothetical protein